MKKKIKISPNQEHFLDDIGNLDGCILTKRPKECFCDSWAIKITKMGIYRVISDDKQITITYLN